MDSPFNPCRERVVRAIAHRESLGERWNRFMEDEDIYDPSVHVDGDGTGEIWIEQRAPIPMVFGFLLGEVLYQLRAALDSAIYVAAILESGQDPPPDEDKLEFPICASKAAFQKAAWKIRPLSQARRDIIERIQPYNAPKLTLEQEPFNFNLALAILHDWARKDRHRRLHLMSSWVSRLQPKLAHPPEVTVKRFTVAEGGFFEHETQIATFELDGWVEGMPLKANPDVLIEIAVNEAPPRSRTDTLGVRLEAMVRATLGLIGALETSFGIRKGV